MPSHWAQYRNQLQIVLGKPFSEVFQTCVVFPSQVAAAQLLKSCVSQWFLHRISMPRPRIERTLEVSAIQTGHSWPDVPIFQNHQQITAKSIRLAQI